MDVSIIRSLIDFSLIIFTRSHYSTRSGIVTPVAMQVRDEMKKTLRKKTRALLLWSPCLAFA
jgi:hypothetical protein